VHIVITREPINNTSTMKKIFDEKPKTVMIKMTDTDFHTLKLRAYKQLKTVSQFIREELCK
jgi:hypothetical protein